MTAANLNREQKPNWFKEYTFSEAYKVKNLSPDSLDRMLTAFAMDHSLLELFWQHKGKMGDPHLRIGCDDNCLLNELCAITRQFSDLEAANLKCNQLTEVFWKNVKTEQHTN